MKATFSFQLAYEFLLYIIIGMLIGYFISQQYNNNIFIVIGLLLGIFMAFLNIYRLIRNRGRVF
ncbi:MAG TPA: hypothetical protein EYG76_05150 [Methanothermococcus okinawensis]|uniref:AtpZ/AtpI family protein n=1 Tax=Methanothermococcus okinawensis TaxID=155863 RepID=A0A832YU87_9EURY|nr:hypothetical protein [Methanothermococcus okinawensis]